MSQASRSHALTATRHRLQVARFIAVHVLGAQDMPGPTDDEWCGSCGGDGEHPERVGFDALETGPVVRCDACAGSGSKREQIAAVLMSGRSSFGISPRFDVHAAREAARATRGRVGRRVLAALDGLQSECQALTCAQRRSTGWAERECPDCHSTGHNIRGVLQAIEWSPAIRRRCLDAHLARVHDEVMRDCWLDDLDRDVWADAFRMSRTQARGRPRGEHRQRRSNFSVFLADDWPEGSTLDERITARCESWVYTKDGPRSHLPRWRRGELKHAAQREARRLTAEVSGLDLRDSALSASDAAAAVNAMSGDQRSRADGDAAFALALAQMATRDHGGSVQVGVPTTISDVSPTGVS
jgi:hypothetical protein